MNPSFAVIIPARYASSRLPGKLLLDIGGKPLLQHAYDSAMESRADSVFIATDDERIENVARDFGATVIMTSTEHKSGTERIAEVVSGLGCDDESIIVNVQGDEYGLSAAVIDQLADELVNTPDVHMATLCKEIKEKKQYLDPNAVKVVFDRANNAISFSRSPVPWSDIDYVDRIMPAYVHIGLYAYRAAFLKTYTSLPHCPLEECERLEQLRVLYHGYKIRVEEVCEDCGVGVDSQEDLECARKMAQDY